jgi:hypothetical protein
VSAPPVAPPEELTPEERRWLHDKYSQLASEESQLAGIRSSYSITIGAVLITGLAIAVAGLNAHPQFLLLIVTFLSAFGLFQSIAWALLLHHTLEAQALWRNAVYQLEQSAPPIRAAVPGHTRVRGGAQIKVDLAQPFTLHHRHFAPRPGLPPFTRARPSVVMESMPNALIIIWLVALISVWGWYLVTFGT